MRSVVTTLSPCPCIDAWRVTSGDVARERGRAGCVSKRGCAVMSLRGRLTSDGTVARQTPFWICSECGNMLYPKEDHGRRCLQRVCRNCGRVDDADNNLVYVNDLRPESQAADAGVDVIKDPTLPRAVGTECSSCGHDEAVFFQAPMKGDQAMKLIFMCTRWLRLLLPLRRAPPAPPGARGGAP